MQYGPRPVFAWGGGGSAKIAAADPVSLLPQNPVKMELREITIAQDTGLCGIRQQ